MSARRTDLSITAYSLDGNDLLGQLQAFEFDPDVQVEDNRGIADRHEENVEVKRTNKHTFEILQDNSGAVTNLNVTVFTLGANVLVGDLKSGTLSVRNQARDGSGIGTLDTFPNAVGGTATEVTGQLLVASSAAVHALLTAINSATSTDRNFAAALTIGGMSFAQAMKLVSAKHKGSRGELQVIDVKLVGRAAPSSPTGANIYGVPFTGDALFTLACNTGMGQWSGTGFVENMDIKFDDAAIVKNSGGMWMQGGYTYATS